MRRLWREKRQVIFISILLLSAFIGVDVKRLHAEIIDFEESISLPDVVTIQYCGKGVEVIGGGRIFQHSVTTANPTHVLYNDFGQEFDETASMDISFTAGQTEVSVKVGLDRAYPFITLGVPAKLLSYSSDTLDTGSKITEDSKNLGNQETSINRELKVSDASGDIRSERSGGSSGRIYVTTVTASD